MAKKPRCLTYSESVAAASLYNRIRHRSDTGAIHVKALPQNKSFLETLPIVIGESMGCGVASAAVATPTTSINATIPAIQGLVLITPWDSLAELAQTHYWYLPARWLVRDRYDNVRNLQSFKAPKAIVTAGLDKIIPVKHGNTLFAAIPSVKAQFMLDSAGHNDWLNYVDNQWWQELITFVITGVATSSDNQPSIQSDD